MIGTISAAGDSEPSDLPRISTGSDGLDDILGGGFDANRMYLYEGRPGTGKTTIALQFLLKGVRGGERVLYISLSETRRELNLVARRHGWSLEGVDIFELVPPETTLDPDRELTVFHPAEMELSETTGLIFKEVERINPARVVLDSLSELRLLAQNPLRYRRQVLALKHFFTKRNCTVVLLDDLSSSQDDLQLHSIAHGVVMLEQLAIDYGAERRRLRVIKMRGIRFRGGFHDFTIEREACGYSPPDSGRTPQAVCRRVHPQWQRRTRQAPRRRARARYQRAAHRGCRSGQVLRRADLCDSCG